MKKILGLDLGTTSIGWAIVNEAEGVNEKSEIIKLGVRVNPLTVDEQSDFEKGKAITTNADRTLKRSARRNLQRYKLRRENLIEILIEHNLIDSATILSEHGNRSTFKTYEVRAKAAIERIELADFAKVLLMINKKRGYKSSRKAKNQEEGTLIDGMEVAKELYTNNLTPGEFAHNLLISGKSFVPDFYRSDLESEFDRIWEFQKQFYPEILNEINKEKLRGQKKRATSDFFEKILKIDRPEIKGKWREKKLKFYEYRAKATKEKLLIGEVAEALIETNGDLANSSGYLGDISDRSKELYFNKITVGQYLWNQIKSNPHTRLKGQVFYRKDYLDEFETIWTEQSKHHSVLTSELKSEIRDVIIFYQRRLKSQKGLISFCEFESRQIEIEIDGKKKLKTIGAKVCPKSSPLFQEFKIWQILNNIELTHKHSGEKRILEQEEKELLFEELSTVEKLSKTDVLKLFKNPKELDINYKDLEGNRTITTLYNAFIKIAEISGHDSIDFSKLSTLEKKETLTSVFNTLGISSEILNFRLNITESNFENQEIFKLWHLLYSYEEDNSATGNDRLLIALKEKYGFQREYAMLLTNISFQPDYGSLSSKAIKKILPFLREGNKFDVAAGYAGYNHSDSKTKEENDSRILKDKLQILPKNSLRNPVVEKILNQTINVVKAVIDEFGKPDEVRIELARELKKSAKERESMTSNINTSKDYHEKIRKILESEFGLNYVSRNDIIRYKLYKELEFRGYKTLYTDTYIPKEKLFSKEFDIEHIIPQAKLYDDSFSNKTLEVRSANIEKANDTALDYIIRKYGEDKVPEFKNKVESMFTNEKISKAKRNKLIMKGSEIPDGFIERDLRNTQYIAKKTKALLEEVFRNVTTTTGLVTDRLREDWQLVDVMKELNWDKYKQLGLTEEVKNKDGNNIKIIKDWTKRNDQRHHAMDALTVAFTKRNHVQYLNNLNARSDKSSSIYGIEQKELYRDEKGKLRFKPPIPLNDFRNQAKLQLENVFVSFKAKNKVVTRNKNSIQVNGGNKIKTELTPRGQLHLESVYGKIKQYKTDEVKIGGSFNTETISKVASKKFREALLKRLSEFENDPKKAFTGKNSLEKNPIYLDELQTSKVPEKVKIVSFEDVYTIRKDISPDLKTEKVIDVRIRKLLENRLKEYGNEPKKAFSNLDENPIWLNKEKAICIKRVTISGISNAVALHSKKDKDGKFVLDENGKEIPVDFVNTGNNHHVAIYRDAEGSLQDNVVSFFEALERINQGLPAINKSYKSDEGWKFLFSMKQNEFFIFPNESSGFNPSEIDILDPKNHNIISPNLFRVQKFSKVTYGNSSVRDYVFRHHIEANLNDKKEIKDIAYKSVKSLPIFNSIVKVRINHLGKIVGIGEY
jgi:CRISPR-associated endonuclease Csn1